MDAKVFVTVGSTSFDQLISTMCDSKVRNALEAKGYKKLTLQIGRGTVTPGEENSLDVEWYRYKDDLTEDMKSSSLIISHAGAGSILQALELQKPLIVVINDKLMDNHQTELAEELSVCGFLKYCYCSNLATTITELNVKELKPYVRPDPKKFLHFFDQIMGYDD